MKYFVFIPLMLAVVGCSKSSSNNACVTNATLKSDMVQVDRGADFSSNILKIDKQSSVSSETVERIVLNTGKVVTVSRDSKISQNNSGMVIDFNKNIIIDDKAGAIQIFKTGELKNNLPVYQFNEQDIAKFFNAELAKIPSNPDVQLCALKSVKMKFTYDIALNRAELVSEVRTDIQLSPKFYNQLNNSH